MRKNEAISEGPASFDKIDWETFRGKRWLISRTVGEDLAMLHLHRQFNGNAAAAADFLGFATHAPVARRWIKMGLSAMGKDAPRQRWSKYPERSTAEWREEYVKLSQQREKALVYDWQLPVREKVGVLVSIADLHCQSTSCDYGRFLELRDWIASEKSVRWFLGGDTFDVRTRNSVGTSKDEFCPLNVAEDLLAEDLKPISGKGIAVFAGNHEARIAKEEDIDACPAEDLAERLDIPYMGICGHIKHVVGKQSYTHFHHHGRGSARTDGAKLNAGEAIANIVTSELVTVGHLHFEATVKLLRRHMSEDNYIENAKQRLVMLPSFFAYRGYPQDGAYRPSALGAAAIHMGAKEHKVRVVE